VKNCQVFSIILIVFCIVVIIPGCIESNGNGPVEFNKTSEEESQQIAETSVRNLNSYREYNLTEPNLVDIVTLRCPYCWEFVYKFDLISEKDPAVIDTATVNVTVIEGKVVGSVYAQGSKM